MTLRRIPLGDVSNAANSPARHIAPCKRTREHDEAQENFYIDPQPKAKRQALDTNQLRLRVSPAKQSPLARADRLFTRPNRSTNPTAFERKLLAAKEEGAQQRVQKQDRAQENLSGVRKWQQYYKKAFPTFVFYFESVPEETRMRYSKTVRGLGAREEKFFSKAVTHLVTNRSVPAPTENQSTSDLQPPSSLSIDFSQPRTINPSLLEQSNDVQSNAEQSKSKFNFEAHIRKANPTIPRDVELRKPPVNREDVLLKAQGLGMKIWHLDKLERILATIFEVSSDSQNIIVSQALKRTTKATTGRDKDAELSRMIRHERLHGPSDRDVSTSLNEMIQFKGPYILVRDIDERTKPIVAKEWPKPAKKGENGEWPQFRAVGHGKCPFVEDISREELEREIARQEEVAAQQRQAKSREASQSRQVSRAVTPQEIQEDDDASCDVELAREPERQAYQKPLQETRNSANIQHGHREKPPVPQFCPPPSKLPNQTRSQPKTLETTRSTVNSRPTGFEPAASGVQPSNITSAIRSQVISSTAAVPFAKGGTSKEVYGLQRKVLEKNAGPALNAIQNRQHPGFNHGRAEAQICLARQARPHSREALTQIHEEPNWVEEEEDVWLTEDVRTREAPPKQEKPAKKKTKDAKPGYCENCRDKYDDFDEHILGRRHRKFALTPENWKDLDKLLAKLIRPLRSPEPDGF